MSFEVEGGGTPCDPSIDPTCVAPQFFRVSNTIEIDYLWLQGPVGSGIDSGRSPDFFGAQSTLDCIARCLNSVYSSSTGTSFQAVNVFCTIVPSDLDFPPDGIDDFDGDGILDSQEILELRTWLYDNGNVPSERIVIAPVGNLLGASGLVFGTPSQGAFADNDNLCFIADNGDCRTFAHEVAHCLSMLHNDCFNNIQVSPRSSVLVSSEIPIPPSGFCPGSTVSSEIDFKIDQVAAVRERACDPSLLMRTPGGRSQDDVVPILCEPKRATFEFLSQGTTIGQLVVFRRQSRLYSAVIKDTNVVCNEEPITIENRNRAEFTCGETTIVITRNRKEMRWSDGQREGILRRRL